MEFVEGDDGREEEDADEGGGRAEGESEGELGDETIGKLSRWFVMNLGSVVGWNGPGTGGEG